MDFFGSISMVFCVWQVFCLSPFSLKNINKLKREAVSATTFKICSFTMITIQAFVTILSLAFIQYIWYDSSNQIILTFDIIGMLLAQLSTLVIFIESYQQRSTQREILRKINTIDFILTFKMGILTDYVVRRNANIKQLLQWLILNISVFIINLVVMESDVYLWWLVLYGSVFISSLRYLQIVVYVDLLQHRYNQINQFVNNLQNSEGKSKCFIDDYSKIETICTLIEKYKSRCIYEKITDLKQVFRLLHSTNRSLNQMFKWSMPLIILNNFFQIMVNSYWFLMIIFFNADLPIYLIGLCAWLAINMNHLISLSSACHHAAQEVNTILTKFQYSIELSIFIYTINQILFPLNQAQCIPAYLHKLDFCGRDQILREMV